MKCMLTRWTLSKVLDSGRPLSKNTLSHLETCADCTRFRERLYLLDARLRTEAEHARPPVAVVSPLPARWPLFAAAAVAAVVLVLALRPTQAPSPTPTPIASTDAPTPFVDQNVLPMMQTAERLSVGRLGNEWQNLVADSRHGLHHVLTVSGVNDLVEN